MRGFMIDIIYKDSALCVCFKPRGVLSEGEGEDCLPSLLSRTLASAVYPVHRLDKDTEGLMVFALTKEAAADLSRQIAEGSVEKEYEANITRAPHEPSGKFCDLLFYDRQRGRSYVVDRQRKGVKDASLEYKVLSTEPCCTRVRVRLLTGRTHQIRVQFASRGMPLCGDRRYGAPKESGEFYLRSCYLKFKHPKDGKVMEFGVAENKIGN